VLTQKPSGRSFFGIASAHTTSSPDLPYVLFGGFESGRKPELQDTWTLMLGQDQNGLATAAWSQIQVSGRSPSARAGHVLAPAGGGRVQLFGGGNFDWARIDARTEPFLMRSILPVSDIHWEYDAISQIWTQLQSAGGQQPTTRSFAGFTHGKGKRSDLMFLFGGVDGNGNALQDVWEYDLNSETWTELTFVLTGRPPTPRFGMGFVCDDYGDLYILGGMTAAGGQLDLYKVPLPSYAADVPQTRSEWIDLYDGDSLVGKQSDPASELTGVIHLCSPLGSPVYPCSVKIQGQVLGWRAMLRCDGGLGCNQILFDSASFECAQDNLHEKVSPTVEVSAGASVSVVNSHVSGCSSQASGGFVRAYDRATVTVDGSTIRACQSSGSGGALALYGSALQVSESVFDQCTASGKGGAVWADTYVRLPLPAVFSSIKIDKTTFAHCTSGQDGGAMFMSGGSLALLNGVFDSNAASGSAGGGGLMLVDVSAEIIFEVESEAGQAVQNNRADAGGGGVLLWQGKEPRVFVLCSPGSVAGAGGCVACVPGTFNAISGQSSCQPCEPGSYAAEAGAAVCTKCPAGSYSPSSGSNTSDSCLSCPQDATSVEGSSSLDQCTCKEGYETRDDYDTSMGCLPCAAGMYKEFAAQAACVSCPEGFYTETPASTYCKACPPGRTSFLASQTLADCYCKPGTVGPPGGEGSCVSCPKGKASATGGAGPCDDCTPGKYSDAMGRSECSLCAWGTYSELIGSTQKCDGGMISGCMRHISRCT
jgi:hypothetical protein